MDDTRILVVEDDADINEVVCERLGRDGYACVSAYSGSEARLALEQATVAGSPYDLVVTDLMLPGLSGDRLVAGLRESGSGVPVVVISARGAVDDRIGLLRLGADDYLVKPFDLDELSARIGAQLRGRGYADGAEPAGGGARAAAPDDGHTVLEIGRWRLDVDAHTFRIDDGPVSLTNIEFAIIELLMNHPDTVFSKRQVYELCWGEPYTVDDNTVTAHISKIRAKLRASGTDGYIRTVWGLGVKLTVPR
ncbi:response regulator transcription factor [uncultured Bifidobacterium sp.]|uniref:response regulator transcription factor n=1 Tax=uncultured Bifidobacterium sp. TaxID=165187 RepID=UPI002589F498|nr:response regulator transcription factor [uncultured Bifidobacterium sp.]